MDLEAIRRKIMENIQAAKSDTAAIDQATADADRANTIAGVGSGLAQILTAEGVSRGAKAPDLSAFDRMRQQSQDAIKAAIEGRKAKENQAMQAGMLELSTAKDQAGLDRQAAQDQAAAAQLAADNQFKQDKMASDTARAQADSEFARAKFDQDERQFQARLDETARQKDLDRQAQAAKNTTIAKHRTEKEERLRNILKQMDALDKQIQDTGTYELTGPANEKFQQFVDTIAIDSAKLFDPESVARESEVANFKQILPKVTATSMTNSTARELLNNYKNILKDRAQVDKEVFGSDRLNEIFGGDNSDTKVINGTTYKKVPGGWEAQ